MNRTIAVDLDGVLYNHLGGVAKYLRNRWGYILRPEEVQTFNPARMTGVEHIDRDLLEQIKNPRFYMDMEPFDGALAAVDRLSRHGILVVVSNRPNHVLPVSRLRVTADFGNEASETGSYFREIHLYERWAKWRACKALRAAWAIDDNPTIAEEYARHKIVCFLVGGQGRKDAMPHRYIKRVQNLAEVADWFDEFSDINSRS